MKRILITGATGQIGTELVAALRKTEGVEWVVASSRHRPQDDDRYTWDPFEILDVTDRQTIVDVLRRHRIDTVYHLAAVLSAVGEEDPQRAWSVNVNGWHHVLEGCRECGVGRIFFPSSIAAFGPDTPRTHTPQDTINRPTTMYGVTKVTGELLGDYYVNRYEMDIRGIRYPGVISSETPPGGGTTDYAVEIFYEAIRRGYYQCFVRANTVLPMIYMPDCIRAAIMLMQADGSQLQHHNGFNVAAMSFSADELAREIKKHLPEFECDFAPDQRQAIADSWPRDLDDTAARKEWNWQPEYGLAEMTRDMLLKLSARERAGNL